MLDLKLFREDPERIRAGLAARGNTLDIQPIIDLDSERRNIIAEADALKNERKTASKKIGELKKAGEDAEPQMAAVRALGEKISAFDARLAELETELHDRVLGVPNIPGPDTPAGLTEDDNVDLGLVGEVTSFDFDPLPHWELGERLGLFDFPRGARMAGSGFPVLVGQGARLSRALIQFMLDLHTTEHGYTELAVPFMCNSAAMTGTGQLPKFRDDQYGIDGEDLWLIPTAEVPLTNFHGGEILDHDLKAEPVCLTGYTPCFRKEAGAAGKLTRGLNRLHQFDKVELVRLVHPDNSYAELDLLLGHAETVLSRLGLAFRRLSLCAGDISGSSARTVDLELWAPGQNLWLEVSSCSNFEDYQARRAGIKFRDEDGKAQFVHTLNGSGVALPRLIVALIENGQRADGTVALPEALHPYLGGMTELK